LAEPPGFNTILIDRRACGTFVDQTRIADAVSDLYRDIFGIEKTSVRVIIGVASLPLGVPIELDVLFEVR
jgi:hypothetical protein